MDLENTVQYTSTYGSSFHQRRNCATSDPENRSTVSIEEAAQRGLRPCGQCTTEAARLTWKQRKNEIEANEDSS